MTVFETLVPRRGEHEWTYWRRVVRASALCHDMGHLPFSHAAEKDLLPEGIRHEDLSRELILSDWLAAELRDLKINADDVAKIALGPKYFARAKGKENYQFSTWESILLKSSAGMYLAPTGWITCSETPTMRASRMADSTNFV